MTTFQPIELEYTLSRFERLVAHVKVWGLLIPLVLAVSVLPCVMFVQLAVSSSAWFLLLCVFPLAITWTFWVGWLQILLFKDLRMRIRLEEQALGFALLGGELWWVFLDGVLEVERTSTSVLTIVHRNGTVISVPARLLSDEAVAHIEAKAAFGKTPEGIAAVIERGRLIQALEAEGEGDAS